MTDNASNDDKFEPEDFEGRYIVDDDTEALIATVVGVIRMAAMVQVSEDARENLEIIAEALADRFGIEESMVVEEQIHNDPETGEEEIIYKPKGGLFQDDDEDPAVDSKE
jgi:predicted nuclease with TOPRIM domain